MLIVNVQHYSMLRHDKLLACSQERDAVHIITFMRDGAISHTAILGKAFLEKKFCQNIIISRDYRFPWHPRSLDLKPADVWLYRYLKFRVRLRWKMRSCEKWRVCIRTSSTLLLLDLCLDFNALYPAEEIMWNIYFCNKRQSQVLGSVRHFLWIVSSAPPVGFFDFFYLY